MKPVNLYLVRFETTDGRFVSRTVEAQFKLGAEEKMRQKYHVSHVFSVALTRPRVPR